MDDAEIKRPSEERGDDATDDTRAEPAPPAEPDDPSYAVGAYLLDALSVDERAAFESVLAASPALLAEARALAIAAALLPKLLDIDDVELPATLATDDLPVVSPDLRGRIIAAAEAEFAARLAPASVAIPGTEIEPTITESARDDLPPPIPLPARPQGRIRGGVRTAPGQTAPTPIESIRRVPTSWLAAAALAIFAVGALIWALGQQGRLDDKNREITAQASTITAQATTVAQLRNSANASAYLLSPTQDGAPGSSGTLFYSLQNEQAVLVVQNLPQPAENKEYQLWYVNSGEAPHPGPTFTVDGKGNGFVQANPSTPTFQNVALTQEPAGGSQAPTSPIVLLGALGGAAG